MSDYIREESETDRLIDEWHERMPPLTDDERKRIIDKVHQDIEAMTREVEQAGNAS